MTNAEKFIDLVQKLYSLNEKAVTQMQNNVPEIDAEFGDYYWDDIAKKVQFYYVRKNDKTRPTVAHIIALLETDPAVKKRVPDIPDTPNQFSRPTTKLWSIRDDFDRMVDILIDGGVFPDEDGNYRNVRAIVDPDTDLPVMTPLLWLKGKLSAVKENNPDLFARYPFATELEQLAIALGNKLILIKVRDWAKLCAAQRSKK